MKKRAASIKLNRETLRHLNEGDIQPVAAGVISLQWTCGNCGASLQTCGIHCQPPTN